MNTEKPTTKKLRSLKKISSFKSSLIFKFEWDLHNFRKISEGDGRLEITPWGCEQVFYDKYAIIDIYHKPKGEEVRYMAIGAIPIINVNPDGSNDFKVISVFYTYRGNKIRIFSTNFAKPKLKLYAEIYKFYWENIVREKDAYAERNKRIRS